MWTLPTDWPEFETEDGGMIALDPAQVAGMRVRKLSGGHLQLAILSPTAVAYFTYDFKDKAALLAYLERAKERT